MNHYIKHIVETFNFNNSVINEISNSTVINAANKVGNLTKILLEPNGKNSTNVVDNFKINSDEFEKYLNTLSNKNLKLRLIKLYKENKLVPLLLRQKHVLSTIANSNLGWFSEHNISLSPEFYNSEGSLHITKYEQRKPTEKEHKFFRYYSSLGADTVGMTDLEKDEFHKILQQYWLDTTGIDPFAI